MTALRRLALQCSKATRQPMIRSAAASTFLFPVRSTICAGRSDNNTPLQQTAWYSYTTTTSMSSSNIPKDHAGAGTGNVHDQMLPSSMHDKDLFRYTKYPRTVSIIGAPMTYGQPYVGTDTGPKMLREKGLRPKLTKLGWRVEDMPDLDFDPKTLLSSDGKGDTVVSSQRDPPNAKNCALVGRGSSLLADVVESKLRKGFFPLIVGGDHSIGLGSLTGILRVRPDTGIIWVDAHADLNTPHTSSSGNFHGMPLGLLMNHPDNGPAKNFDFSTLPGFEFLDQQGPRISPEQLVYVGLRDVDPAERIWIQRLGIKTFTMTDIDHLGIGRVMDEALAHLKGRPLHLSYDIDSVDPMLAPATGTTVRGGLTYREAHFVAEFVAQSGDLASAEIVEVNPSLSSDDGANETVELGLQLITSFMGKSII
ncbi:arginase [Nitzschia inconspicua]|uniref:Arginase n=1 Tax=Nitzschia inconspicua TaxID=303405 RepID=A0A9K3LGZ0_9STRA|nr:arginase [Nitzschia inconspicua]